MKSIIQLLILLGCLLTIPQSSQACSVIYYVDQETGKIYVVNNEAYWNDTKAYIQIEPRSKSE